MATSKDVPVEVVGESEVSTVVSDFSDRSESEPEQPNPEPPVVSLLSRLKAPILYTPSDLF